jgi:hypothetical protein
MRYELVRLLIVMLLGCGLMGLTHHIALTAFQVWSQIWDRFSIHSQVFGHISANIWSLEFGVRSKIKVF